MRSLRPSVLLITLATLVFGSAMAQTAYEDRFRPDSGVALHLWKDGEDKDKDFARYTQDAQASIARYHYKMPTGAPLPVEPLAKAIGPREWPLHGQNCSASNTDGILLVHGLSDSPYLMRDLGEALSQQPIAAGRCVLVRSLLLPGHATTPGDLLRVKYEDLVAAAGYGIRSFAGVATQVHLVGFSTGGALGIYWAYHQNALKAPVSLASLTLLSPAIRPTGFFTRLTFIPYLVAKLSSITGLMQWSDKHLDQDFAKYESFPLNAGYQIVRLDNALAELLEDAPMPAPVYMALSRNDATVNAEDSVRAFLRTTDPRNQMLLAAPQGSMSTDGTIKDALLKGRVRVVDAVLPDSNIVDMAHVAFPVKPDNPHYGASGAYAQCLSYAKQPLDASDDFCACITNQMQAAKCNARATACVQYGEPLSGKLQNSTALRRLTFNPYFDQMVGEIRQFLSSATAP